MPQPDQRVGMSERHSDGGPPVDEATRRTTHANRWDKPELSSGRPTPPGANQVDHRTDETPKTAGPGRSGHWADDTSAAPCESGLAAVVGRPVRPGLGQRVDHWAANSLIAASGPTESTLRRPTRAKGCRTDLARVADRRRPSRPLSGRHAIGGGALLSLPGPMNGTLTAAARPKSHTRPGWRRLSSGSAPACTGLRRRRRCTRPVPW